MVRSTCLLVHFAVAAVVGPTFGALPRPAAAQSVPGGWTFSLESYGWLTAMTGTAGAGSVRVPVDNSFIDTLKQADSVLAFSGHAEARRGPIAVFLDGMWSRLGVDDVSAGPARVDVTSTFALAELGGAYEVLDRGFYSGRERGWSLEALAGGRYTYIGNTIDLRGGGSASSNVDWVDPFAGLRLRVAVAPRWDASLRGDIGGWGAGSRFTWNVQALVGYRFRLFGTDAAAVFGYRALSQDYESRRLVWDVTLHGPVIGLNLHF
ncbi:hypothetical protein [Paracraurococcus lichenis]|uniref:Outer membrane protein beta-barrel domain-containing protein n=1 Tax=Paracraurococcus lichenis TaxID=3064888 RepID=A0ABT9EBY0_9PROT|nr:hypothetical protein [Paracraurococcus sp. LOR1-02]MDO9713689.1 hypothetical protein [Paracraurococcus sp. LOR1-02]